MAKEIKATAPTPQDWIDLVRENERLKLQLGLIDKQLNENELIDYARRLHEIFGEQNK